MVLDDSGTRADSHAHSHAQPHTHSHAHSHTHSHTHTHIKKWIGGSGTLSIGFGSKFYAELRYQELRRSYGDPAYAKYHVHHEKHPAKRFCLSSSHFT